MTLKGPGQVQVNFNSGLNLFYFSRAWPYRPSGLVLFIYHFAPLDSDQCWQHWRCLWGRSRSRSVAGVWQEASVPDGWWFLCVPIPHWLPVPVSPSPLTKFTTFASEKYFVNRSSPAPVWRRTDGREIWTSVQNFGTKFESINSVF